MAANAFKGWTDEALTFFGDLEANNNKPFWLEHKAVYDEQVRAPMEAFGEIVADDFGPLRLFRPNRDVRFSKDKSPYKTALGAATEDEGGWSFYVQISAEGLFAGSGAYHMARDQLERFRSAVDDDTTGPPLAAMLEPLRKKGFGFGGNELKTAPRGYPRDHPRIALLRLKGITVHRMFEPAAWLHTRAAAKKVTDVWLAAKPITEWWSTNVGPSTEPPDDGWGR